MNRSKKYHGLIAALLFVQATSFADPRPTYPVQPEYVNEQNGTSEFFGSRKIHYETSQVSSSYRVTIKDGLLYDSTGSLLSTHTRNRVNGLFVMDEAGNFYIASGSYGYFHHSSFLAGQAVASAGEIEVHYGRVYYLSNNSGHYKIPSEGLIEAGQTLAKQRVDLSSTRVVFMNLNLSPDEAKTKLGVESLQTHRKGCVWRILDRVLP
jgi:hypothetical protein